ncbi:MAG: hypothetical protein JWO33_2663 [Caulobacteraceae bacterium]|nr:hypothetical protein [Caulobacteraceae bacterium]
MLKRYALAGFVSLAVLVVGARAQDDAPKTPLPPQTPVVPFGQPGKTMLTTKDLMRYVLNPAAETFWAAGGEIDEGEKRNLRTPATEAKWYGALQAAAAVMETGNLLMVDGRMRTDPQWAKWSADLNNAGVAGIKAAQARDGEATFAAGGDMYEACFACHAKYITRTRQEMKPLPDLPGEEKPKALR